MKFTKSIAAMAAVSLGMMFAGAANVNANSTVKHTVQEGDTISALSQQYKVSQKKIQKANKSKDINTIYVGEVFVFDGKGNVKVDKKSAKAPAKKATISNNQAATSVSNNATAAVNTNTTSTNTTKASSATSATSPSASPAKSTNNQATTPVVKTAAPAAQSAPAAKSTPVSSNGTMSGIAQAESGNDYNARNGQYVGKYQLSSSYLNGDYSPENQERVAQQYAVSRYGSVEAAAAYHASHGSW